MAKLKEGKDSDGRIGNGVLNKGNHLAVFVF